MLYVGNDKIGKMYLGSTEIAKAYLGTQLVYQRGSGPVVSTVLSISSTELFGGKSIGGYIDTSSKKWANSTTYYGVVIDLNGYEGYSIKFTRSESWTAIRYAYLSASTYSNGGTPSYASGCSLVNDTTNSVINEIIPQDGHYLFVYVKSSSTNVAPAVEISGLPLTALNRNLEASLFSTNTTIGTNGTVYTGSTNAPTQVCSGYLPVSEYSYGKAIQFIVNAVPSGYYDYRICVAEYTVNKGFIRRGDYGTAPFTYQLKPETGWVRIIVVVRIDASTNASGNVVRFDNDMLQTKGTNI